MGIYIIISNSNDFNDNSESDKNELLSNIFKALNLSVDKCEKDIGLYKTTIKKMLQAKELIEELKVKDKKKES